MSLISKLRGIFGLGGELIEEPMQEFIDPVLGAMKWNEYGIAALAAGLEQLRRNDICHIVYVI